MKSKKVISIALVLSLVASLLCGFGMTAGAEGATQLYVALDGNDTNSGSISAPFATLEAAKNAARKIDGQVIINIRGGQYPVTSTLELTAEDSNTTYRAYKDEEVILNAANVLNVADFKAISAEKKALIIDQKASANVKMIDLKALGITEYGTLKCIGMGVSKDKGYPAALYINDEMQTISRYPNGEYVETGEVVAAGAANTDEGWTIKVDAATKGRMKKWTDANDVWVFGYFMHDWAENHLPVREFDAAKGTLSTAWIDHYGIVAERRYYYYNLLEELDAPGEWYLDREEGVLYVYPSETMEKVEFITFDKPFINATNVENVLIKNIHFEKGIGEGIVATDVKNFVVDSCELSSISDNGVTITQSETDNAKTANSGVKNSYIHDMGAGGILITAGSRKDLIPGNCFATNNHIERFSKIKTTYTAGITLRTTGNKADYNEINDAPHFAIQYQGNDLIMEYNDIYRVCTDTADSGAIYTGRDWTTRGCEIRYNYFHDMKMIGTKTGMRMQAVYLDDMHSYTKVNGNIFYKVSSIALFGGGRYNEFTNNLILESDDAFRFDARGLTWMQCGEGSQIMNNLKAMPYQSGIWAEKYPELVGILDDEPAIPKHNIIKNNVTYQTPDMVLDQNVTTYGTVENNIMIGNTKGFTDYKNQDFSLVADGSILKQLPDFEIVDYKKIGRYEVTEKDTDFEEEGAAPAANVITLVIGSDKLYKGDQVVTLDVPAQVKNDRTLVPLRAIFEALGATVEWEEATQTVTSTKGDITIKLTIGSDKLYKNDTEFVLDVPAQVVNDRTLVPVRAISESFGCQVGWEEATQTVTITVQ